MGGVYPAAPGRKHYDCCEQGQPDWFPNQMHNRIIVLADMMATPNSGRSNEPGNCLRYEIRTPKSERGPNREARSCVSLSARTEAMRRTCVSTFAIRISEFFRTSGIRFSGFPVGTLHLALCLALLTIPPVHGAQPTNPAPGTSISPAPETFPQRYQRLYREARARWQQETNSEEAAWQFARACFDWGDFTRDKSQLAAIAEEGIAASRRAIQLAPKSAAAHYYLGLNLGQLAQTKMLGALKLINEMEVVWLKAAELDARFDYAGPHRSLAILYRDAPGWSVGSKAKSRLHFQKAVELAPEYPGNHLAWIESLLDWNDIKTAQQKIPAMEEVMKSAREKFKGDEWSRDWHEWERQWKQIQTRGGKP